MFQRFAVANPTFGCRRSQPIIGFRYSALQWDGKLPIKVRRSGEYRVKRETPMSDDARAAQLSIQQANHFSLSGGHIHVDYSSTSINGQPRLAYHDPARNPSFVRSDIRTVDVPD